MDRSQKNYKSYTNLTVNWSLQSPPVSVFYREFSYSDRLINRTFLSALFRVFVVCVIDFSASCACVGEVNMISMVLVWFVQILYSTPLGYIFADHAHLRSLS